VQYFCIYLQAKLLDAEFKKLSPETKEKYVLLADLDNNRYKQDLRSCSTHTELPYSSLVEEALKYSPVKSLSASSNPSGQLGMSPGVPPTTQTSDGVMSADSVPDSFTESSKQACAVTDDVFNPPLVIASFPISVHPIESASGQRSPISTAEKILLSEFSSIEGCSYKCAGAKKVNFKCDAKFERLTDSVIPEITLLGSQNKYLEQSMKREDSELLAIQQLMQLQCYKP